MQRFEYSALPSDEQDLRRSSIARKRRLWSFCIPAILIAILIIISSSIGYVVGSKSREERYSGLISPAGSTKQVFIYNQTFARPPTERSPEAWRSLFPKNGGFIHHPVLAKNFSGIAVFHQLHCLQALYNLYYGVDIHHGPHGKPLDPAVHARHCFDYLRQTLMCHADTNMEPYNFTLDGVTGWGTKTCRDYNAVVDFANTWGGSEYADAS